MVKTGVENKGNFPLGRTKKESKQTLLIITVQSAA